MQTLIQSIAKFIVLPFVFTLTLAGYNVNQPHVAPTPAPQVIYEVATPQVPNLGATNAIDTPVALFSTSLATGISSTDTTITLVSAATLDGTTLASSTYGFVIDEGTAVQEFVRADCTGTSCTGVVRGISALTGTTSVAALAHTHRRGASVKITDHPYLTVIGRIVNGIGTFPNIISYTSHPTFTATTQLIDKKYVDDTAFSGAGVIDATAAARGVTQLATNLQAASSTATGSSGNLALPSSLATSTYNSTGSLQLVVTKNNNKIDDNFISTTTLFTNATLASTTKFTTGIPIVEIGKQVKVFSSTGTTTFTVPSGVTKLRVQLVAGGGNGAAGSANTIMGGGGGGGGYCMNDADVSATTSIQVFVGAGGSVSSFGPSICSATSGGNGSVNGTGGVGGLGSNGNLNIGGSGGIGSPGLAAGAAGGGSGGSSVMGGGGNSVAAGVAGGDGRSYGGGGGGAANGQTAGAGAQGVVIVEW